MHESQRLLHLDVVRSFAIAAVIGIHVVGTAFFYIEKNSISFNILVLMDQLFRFAVPVFIAISGYLLAFKYKTNISVPTFLARRVLRLIPVYLIFSAVIYVYTRILYDFDFPAHQIWKLILLGKTDYHLYFVSLIFQLYLLFPVLLWFLKKRPKVTLLFAFLAQLCVYFFATLLAEGLFKVSFEFGDQQQYLLFVTWIFYFAIGAYLALFDLSDSSRRKIKRILVVGIIAGYVLSVLDAFRLLTQFGSIIEALRSTRTVLLLYTCSVSVLFIIKDDLLLWEPLEKTLIWLGKNSFIVYLVHTIVLRQFLMIFVPSNLFLVLVLFLLVFGASLVIARIYLSFWNFGLNVAKRML